MLIFSDMAETSYLISQYEPMYSKLNTQKSVK